MRVNIGSWAIASLCALFLSIASAVAEDLKISVWGGSVFEAYRNSVVQQWSDQGADSAHIFIDENIFRNIIQGDVDADVVMLGVEEVQQGCEVGRLEELHGVKIDSPADFYAGAVVSCGVANLGTIKSIVYSPNATQAELLVEEFLNTSKFDGKRGLLRSPVLALELALLADGVRAQDVYPRLRTHDGVEQALTKLLGIRNQIEWWWYPEDAVEKLSNGTVEMTTMWDIIYQAQPHSWKQRFQKTGPVTVTFDYLAIPATSQRKELAEDYISFASSMGEMNALAQALGDAYLLPRWSQTTFADQFGAAFACSSGTCPCKGGGCAGDCCESAVPLSLVSACGVAGECGCPGGGCSSSCCMSQPSTFNFDWSFWVENGLRLGERFRNWLREEGMS